MGRRSRECYLCGQSYQYCPSCSQDRSKPVWMSEFHSEDCKKIFDICTRFNMKIMSKSEAKDALSVCDLSNRANFKSYVQRDLDNIFKEEAPKKRGKRATIKLIDDVMEIDTDPIVVEIKEPAVHEVVTEEIE